MIDFVKNQFLWKIIFSIIALGIIVYSYIPMYQSYELYVRWEELLFALGGGVAIWLVYFIYRPKNSLLYLLWIVVVVIYFYLHIIYFEGKNLRASIVLSIVGIVVVLTPFIASNFKKKKKTSIERPEVYLGRTRAYNRLHFRVRRMMLAPEEESIVRRLILTPKGKAIALYGRWGSGKSHCIQYLSHRLQNKFERTEYDDNVDPNSEASRNKAYDGPFEICNISLWNYKTVDEAWTAIINELYYTITGDRVIDFRGILSCLAKTLPQGEFLSALVNYIQLPQGNQDDELRDRISEKTKDKRILLIFDDIERAPYELIRNLLPLIERLKAIEGMVVLCAIADDELEKVYLEHNVDEDSLHGYLSKIFDFSFYLPQPSYPAFRDLESHLINSKYGDYNLVKIFLKEFLLQYDTPRQLERMLEYLSSLELQYFYYYKPEDITGTNTNNKQKIFCIFLVETVRLFYASVLDEMMKREKALSECFKYAAKYINSIKPRNTKTQYEDKNKNNSIESFKKDFPVTSKYILKDALLRDVLKHLSKCKPEDIDSAIEMDYARRTSLNNRECVELIQLHAQYKKKNIRELISFYFRNKLAEPDSVKMAIHELVDYCTERIDIASHANFIKFIYSTSELDDDTRLYGTAYYHSNNIDRFMKILNVCIDKNTYKMTTYVAAKYVLKNCPISDLYEYLRRILILKNIYYAWGGEKKYINDLDINNPHPYDTLIMILIVEYTSKMLSIVFNGNDTQDVTINEYNHSYFHLYDSDIISDKFKCVFMKEIKRYLSYVPYTKRNLRQLFTYLLSKGNYKDVYDKPIVYTSEWKMTAFTPWLNECLNKVELDTDIRNMIPEWIDSINESISLQPKDEVGQKYKAGAKALLSILETIQGKGAISK